jgi:hypothetical protein
MIGFSIRLPEWSLRAWIGLVTLAAAILFGLTLGLWMIAEPSHAAARIDKVQTAFDQARRAGWTVGDLKRYPPHAVCADIRSVEPALRSRIEAGATKAGVALGTVQIDRLPEGPEPMIGTAALYLAAHGSEPSLRAFLRSLAVSTPVLLTDGLDLASDGAETTLRLKGRVLCHDRRLP